MNQLGIEKMQIVSAVPPINLNGQANNGDWVSMKNFNRCTVLVFAAAGTAANDLTVTLRQASDVSGTGAKALDFTRIDSKEAALQTSVGQFTAVTQAAANTYVSATNGESELIYAIDVQGEDFDVDNGFDCLQVQLSQPGATKIGCALYLLQEPKYQADQLPSAIAN